MKQMKKMKHGSLKGKTTPTKHLTELGAVKRQTKQFLPVPVFPDSTYSQGILPD